MTYRDGRPSEPGLAAGSTLTLQGTGLYQIYLLFSLAQEQATLEVLRYAVATTGVILVILLTFIAALVSRQVVTPVRAARRTAESIASGNLHERMTVRGHDDLARLATSMNYMASELEKQINTLEDLSAVQQRFVSDVSHELRTPLTTVRMAAEVLHDAREDFDPVSARSAELMQAELDRFEALLTDLLEISRFDAGAAVLSPDVVDLREIVDRVLESHGRLAEAYGTEISVHVEGDGDARAEVDARRIERIVRNLLVNAIEHSEGKPIEILIAGDAAAVAIAVRDHGVGFEASQARQVFHRFWRADPARARAVGGTGLGLAISMEDANLHGGWLTAWGRPGLGAQFRLTLPRRRAAVLRDFAAPDGATRLGVLARTQVRRQPITGPSCPSRQRLRRRSRPPLRAAPRWRRDPASGAWRRSCVLLVLTGLAGCVSVPTVGPIETVAGKEPECQNCVGVEVAPPLPGDNPLEIVSRISPGDVELPARLRHRQAVPDPVGGGDLEPGGQRLDLPRCPGARRQYRHPRGKTGRLAGFRPHLYPAVADAQGRLRSGPGGRPVADRQASAGAVGGGVLVRVLLSRLPAVLHRQVLRWRGRRARARLDLPSLPW